MAHRYLSGISLALIVALSGGANADPQHEHPGGPGEEHGGGHPPMHAPEPHPGPQGY